MRDCGRLPLGDLLEYAVIEPRAMVDLAGVTRRTVERWAIDGIPLTPAETACTALGMHPCEVWGDRWISAVLRRTWE